jgi:hypothetical protein
MVHPVRVSLVVLPALVLALTSSPRATAASEETSAARVVALEGAALEAHFAAFDTTIRPFLSDHCLMCHNDTRLKGGLSLRGFRSADAVVADPDTWEKVLEKLRTGEMPPEEDPRPDPDDVLRVARWIEDTIEHADRTAPIDPGRVTVRRLNRAEYNNTVRDLLGVDLRPADDFPQDDSGYGFDTIGDVLSVPPVLMERYLIAAERVARTAIFGPGRTTPTLARYSPRIRTIQPLTAVPASYDATGLTLPNAVHATHRFPVTGEYIVRFHTGGSRPRGSEPIRLALWIDGTQVTEGRLDAEGAASFFENKQDFGGQMVELRAHVEAGDRWVAATVPAIFEGLPPSYNGPNPARRVLPDRVFVPPATATPERVERLRKRFVEEEAEARRVPVNDVRVGHIEIAGPLSQPSGPSAESRARIFTCGHAGGEHGAACPKRIISDLASQAYRRPVGPADVDPLLALFDDARTDGESFDEALVVPIKAMLVSPDFLFRIEGAARSGAEPRPLTDHQLATRLSYFLWATMPDAQLRGVADAGELQKPDVLEREVRRMLQDPRARSLVQEFGGQWLQIRALESAAPDKERFPAFDDYLRLSMRRETELFFERIVREDRSILEFLDAGYSYLNERLAKHYGVHGVSGPEFRLVELPRAQRGGILTQASVLTVSSYATRTSPVLRGKWILENLLHSPPPDPPPGVANLDERPAAAGLSVREQLEAHRADPTCASCHRRMDPLGFGLENYDAIGAWRESDHNEAIDAWGELPDGRRFEGPDQLRAILSDEREAFTKAVAAKLLTYALGRGPTAADRRVARQVARTLPDHDYRFGALVLELVNSPAFRMQTGVTVQ